MPIDTLKVLVRNALKKTGDAMISGFLTLYQDPTDPLHAVTKQYVDALTAGGGAIHRPYATNGVGHYFSPTFHDNVSSFTLGIGNARLGPMFVGGTRSWDLIGLFGHGSAATATVRFGVYELDSTTLTPTSLLAETTTVAFLTGADVFRTASLTLTTTATWVGLAAFVEPTSLGTLSAESGQMTIGAYIFSPFGHLAPGPSGTDKIPFVGWTASGQPGGAMPPASAYALDTTNLASLDGGVHIRMSA